MGKRVHIYVEPPPPIGSLVVIQRLGKTPGRVIYVSPRIMGSWLVTVAYSRPGRPFLVDVFQDEVKRYDDRTDR